MGVEPCERTGLVVVVDVVIVVVIAVLMGSPRNLPAEAKPEDLFHSKMLRI